MSPAQGRVLLDELVSLLECKIQMTDTTLTIYQAIPWTHKSKSSSLGLRLARGALSTALHPSRLYHCELDLLLFKTLKLSVIHHIFQNIFCFQMFELHEIERSLRLLSIS